MLLREVVRARSCCYNPLLRGQRIRAGRLRDYHEDENLRVVRHFITTANFAIHVTSVTEVHVTYIAEWVVLGGYLLHIAECVEWRSRRQTLIKLERLVPVDGRIEGSRLCEQNLQQRKYFKQFRLKKLSFQHYSPVLSISIDLVTGFFEHFPYSVYDLYAVTQDFKLNHPIF